MEVFPIAITKVDWPTLLRITGEQMSRSISRPLDAAGIKVDSPKGFLTALHSFSTSKFNAQTSLRELGNVFGQHYFMSFLIFEEPRIMTRFAFLARRLSVVFNEEENGMILSGEVSTLAQCAMNASSCIEESAVRAIGNRIIYFLEQADLRDLFNGWTRKRMEDNTFTLVKL